MLHQWIKPVIFLLSTTTTANKIGGTVVDACNPVSYDDSLANSLPCS